MPPRTTTTQNPAQHRDRPGEDPAAGDTRQHREPAHARYQQVADALREQITTGVLAPASPLPSETELMAAFGISRPTARAAIGALRAEGLITVLHGKGSFVRRGEDRALHTHPRAIGLTQTSPGKRDTPEYTDAEADAKGDGEGWRVVETPARYRTTATPALALALGTAEYSPLFVYDRLLGGPAGQRIAHRLYLPFATCAEVAALEHNPYRGPGELYGLLAGHYGYLGFTETVRARMPAPDDAAALHIPAGTPMLLTQRTTHTTPARALALEQCRLSAEDTQLAYTLTPQPRTP